MPTQLTFQGSLKFTVIENGEILSPENLGTRSIVLGLDKIIKMDGIDSAKLAASGLGCEVINASGCYIVPGFIDPH